MADLPRVEAIKNPVDRVKDSSVRATRLNRVSIARKTLTWYRKLPLTFPVVVETLLDLPIYSLVKWLLI